MALVVALVGGAIGAIEACGPGGFDGLTGGARDAGVADATLPPTADPNLPAPRPIGPGSGSFVSTSRPSLRWELADPLTGATLELCRARGCPTVDKTYEVSGRSFTVPEDLEPGVWFWRLRGKTSQTYGTKASATWEIVVRGPAATGASPAVHGSIADVNGDGFADLIATQSAPPPQAEFDDLLVFFGGPDGFPSRPSQRIPLGGRAPALAAGVDVNGDGFTDVVVASAGPVVGEDGGPIVTDAAPPIFIDVYRGSEKGLVLGPEQPNIFELPTLGSGLREAGDVDGDGYGDVIATSTRSSFVLLGSANGLAGRVVAMSSEPLFPPTPGRIGLGGFDANGDGFADLLVGTTKRSAPAHLFFGAAGGLAAQNVGLDLKDGSTYTSSALALAAGDFDGDAIVDLAFTATDEVPIPTVGVVNDVCFLRGPAPLLAPGECVAGPTEKGFARSITPFDLDGDKRDDLLFRGSTSVIAFHLNEQGAFDELPGYTFGEDLALTTVLPSRPGLGLWAAARPGQIWVIEGAKIKKTLVPDPFTTFGLIR